MKQIQYLTNNQGVKTSVVISIQDWRRLTEYIKEVQQLEQISQSIREGLREAKKIESGEVPIQSTKEFLDAL